MRLGQIGRTLRADRASLHHIGCADVYVERVGAGAPQRPMLSRLLQSAEAGDLVCVPSLNDLGRSLPELKETVLLFRNAGLHLNCILEEINTFEGSSEIVYKTIEAVVHFQTRRHVDLIKLGMQIAAETGKPTGRPRVDSSKVETAKRLVKAGLPVAEAAKKAELSVPTLYRYLSRL
ncbi:recombinase family protein [Sphingomonas citri]|nr:recombinase family protein [Sphingomonas citri]